MSALMTIAPGRALAAEHAATWAAMIAEGMPNRPQDITSAARTREEQEQLYDDYLYYRRTGKTRPSGVKLAAKPGTSDHEFPPGCAIDVKTGSRTHKWLVANGPRFGVTRPLFDEGEPWHFRFNGYTPTAALAAITQEGSTMRVIRNKVTGQAAMFDGETFFPLRNLVHASEMAHIFEQGNNGPATGEPLVVDDSTFNLAKGYAEQVSAAKYARQMAIAAQYADAPATVETLDVAEFDVKAFAAEVTKQVLAGLIAFFRR